MFRRIVTIAIVALGLAGASPLAAQQSARPERAGREWVRQHPVRAQRIARRVHHRRALRRHEAMRAHRIHDRQHRQALRAQPWQRGFRAR